MIQMLAIGQQVASALRHDIIAGHMRAGEPLRLRQLADQYGVSATPVREALAALERQGLVEGQANRGFVVATVSSQDLEDMYDLHAYLAQRLTERATPRMTADDIKHLRQLDMDMRRATREERRDDAFAISHEIHRTIMQAGAGRLLVNIMRTTTPFVGRKLGDDIEGWKQQRREGHGAIIDAIERGNSELAGRLMHDHILESGRYAVELFEAEHDEAAEDSA
jgi:DNA-binding GntR family transcriptional regulator